MNVLVVVVKVGTVMISELIELLLAVTEIVDVRVMMVVKVKKLVIGLPITILTCPVSVFLVVVLMQTTGCISLHGLSVVVIDSKA